MKHLYHIHWPASQPASHPPKCRSHRFLEYHSYVTNKHTHTERTTKSYVLLCNVHDSLDWTSQVDGKLAPNKRIHLPYQAILDN